MDDYTPEFEPDPAPEPERQPDPNHPLRLLAAAVRNREAEDEDAWRADNEARFDPTDSMLLLEARPHPGHPDWTPRVFYDPDQFPNEASRDDIRAYYAQRDAAVEDEVERARLGQRVFIPLSAAALDQQALLPFDAEAVLRQRGFVSDEEYLRTGSGPKFRPAYVARNESAVYHFATLLHGTAEIGTAAELPWAVFLNAGTVEHFVGKADRHPVPLTERGGFLLPWLSFARSHPIHLAHDRLWTEVAKDGHADPFHLCRALPAEIAKQAIFELQQAAQIFPGATDEAVLLWQTQVLASLRKAAWWSRFPSDNGARRKAFRVEAAGILRHLRRAWRNGQAPTADVTTLPLGDILGNGGRRVDLTGYRWRLYRRDQTRRRGDVAAEPFNDILTIQDADARLLTTIIDKHRDDLVQAGCGGAPLATSPIRFDITAAQVLIAALHGATYMPDLDPDRPEDRENPLLVLQPLALWLGTLKRRRTGVIDRHVAGLLHRVVTDESDDLFALFEAILEPRLGPGIWDIIFDAAMALHKDERAAPIPMVYRWTRDAERPWAATSEDDTLVVTGPLLDFPCVASAYGAKQVIRATALFRTFQRARSRQKVTDLLDGCAGGEPLVEAEVPTEP